MEKFAENKASTKILDEKIGFLAVRSDEIDAITETIPQRIVEQTNLLALNASIEAARAGE